MGRAEGNEMQEEAVEHASTAAPKRPSAGRDPRADQDAWAAGCRRGLVVLREKPRPFRGHPAKPYDESIDDVGDLLVGLLELHELTAN